MNSKWRPMMGWMYMLVCTMDMVVFPILWSLLQTLTHSPMTQWNPLTLQGAGLFHIAMGAVLGIAAFGRTQEKLGGANNGGAQLPSSGFTAPSAPQQDLETHHLAETAQVVSHQHQVGAQLQQQQVALVAVQELERQRLQRQQ
jgi:hypothetical protein